MFHVFPFRFRNAAPWNFFLLLIQMQHRFIHHCLLYIHYQIQKWDVSFPLGKLPLKDRAVTDTGTGRNPYQTYPDSAIRFASPYDESPFFSLTYQVLFKGTWGDTVCWTFFERFAVVWDFFILLMLCDLVFLCVWNSGFVFWLLSLLLPVFILQFPSLCVSCFGSCLCPMSRPSICTCPHVFHLCSIDPATIVCIVPLIPFVVGRSPVHVLFY